MADFGTSVGLQGKYQPQQHTGGIQFGSKIADILEDQERLRAKEQEAFDKQLSPFASVDTKELLPERIEDYTNSANEVLKLAIDKRKAGNKNVFYDPEVQDKVAKLKEKKAKYSGEYQVAKEYRDILTNPEMMSEYDQDAIDFISNAWQGKAGLNDETMVTQERMSKARRFAKWRTPEIQTKFVMSIVPGKDKDVMTQVVNPDNTMTEKRIKGSQIFETPEGIEMMKKKNKELLLTDSNIARGLLKETQEIIDKMAEEDLVLEDKIKGMTPQEFYKMQVDMTAKRMLDMQIANNKIIDKEFEKRAPSGGSIEFNNFGNGLFKTKSGTYQFDEDQENTTDQQRMKNYFENNKSLFVRNWLKDKGLNPNSAVDRTKALEFYQSEAGQKSIKAGFEKHYPKSPNVIAVTVSSTQKVDDLNPSALVLDSKGNEIEFVPVRYNIDSETDKPVGIYGYKRVKKKDGNKTITELEEVTIPYNINTKGVNAVAPELAELYERRYKRKLDLGVSESSKQSQPTKAAENIPTITSKAEFDKLPKGATYKKADGKTYKKG